MKKYFYFFSLIAIIFVTSCNNAKSEQKNNPEPESTNSENKNIPQKNTTDSTPKLKETDLESNQRLKGYIESAKEQMKDVPSTFIATFEGEEMGDYFHLTFVDEKGNYFDFGDGANEFGEFGEGHHIHDKYVNKKFKLTWDWKTSSFACCEGDMEPVVAKVPSITQLELVE